MSQENLSLVRDLYELLPRLREHDPEPVDRMFRDYADAGFELRLPSDYPEGEQVLRGREGMDAFVSVLRETWSEWGFAPERYFDTPNGVLVFARLVAVGLESGVPVELETNHVWTFHDGRVTSLSVYRDRSQALQAVGLPGP